MKKLASLLILFFGCSKMATLDEVETITSNSPPTALAVAPAVANVSPGETFGFTISGGTPPYSGTASQGTMSPNGVYYASAVGSHSITVEDALGQSVNVQVNVSALGVKISPSFAFLVNGQSITPTVSGGQAPYVWTMTGDGTIDSGTGQYTPPFAGGVATIRATDVNGLYHEVLYRSSEVVTTNMVAWYKPETFASSNEGDLITTWSDSSGQNNHLTASGAQKPIFTKNGVSGVSGIRFDGVDDFMQTASALADTNDKDIFVVFKMELNFNAQDAGRTLISHCGSMGSELAADNCLYRFAMIASTTMSLRYETGAGVDYILESLSFGYYKNYFRFEQNTGSYTVHSLTGGYSQQSGPPLPTGGTSGRLRLATTDGTQDFFKGVITEVLVYSEHLSAGDATKMSSYILLKY